MRALGRLELMTWRACGGCYNEVTCVPVLVADPVPALANDFVGLKNHMLGIFENLAIRVIRSRNVVVRVNHAVSSTQF